MTLSFKVNRQGHVFVFKEIFEESSICENVRIDTKIDFSYHVCNRIYERSCKKVFDLRCFKVKHQGQVTYLWVFWDPRLCTCVGIDTKIKSVACIQPEIWKVIQWMLCWMLECPRSTVEEFRRAIFFSAYSMIPDLFENVRHRHQDQLRIMFTTV